MGRCIRSYATNHQHFVWHGVNCVDTTTLEFPMRLSNLAFPTLTDSLILLVVSAVSFCRLFFLVSYDIDPEMSALLIRQTISKRIGGLSNVCN
jgi:hypothetical protein